jgi:UDP-N-acetylmuramoyl-L-alanyl-D-glutamate--2,6-diaminopimelate ligase
VPHREVAGLKRLCGPIADAFHGAPTARLDVVAVTGTNGKTSCTQWIAQGLQSADRPSAVIGTLGAGQPDALEDVGLTTPDALALQALFARFAAGGTVAVAIEASSIGLHQHRLEGTRIAVAVHTNVTRDHLDYHGTMAAYAQAKAALFAWPGLRAAVVNLDDPWHAAMLAEVAPGVQRIGYRIDLPADDAQAVPGRETGADGGSPACHLAAGEVDRLLVARTVVPTAQGMRIAFDGDFGAATLETPLIGRFNVSNLLAVAASWLALGMGFEQVISRLGRLRPVPGRLQAVAAEAGGAPAPLAVVDYAHTPDALANALDALRPVARARRALVRVRRRRGSRSGQATTDGVDRAALRRPRRADQRQPARRAARGHPRRDRVRPVGAASAARRRQGASDRAGARTGRAAGRRADRRQGPRALPGSGRRAASLPGCRPRGTRAGPSQRRRVRRCLTCARPSSRSARVG